MTDSTTFPFPRWRGVVYHPGAGLAIPNDSETYVDPPTASHLTFENTDSTVFATSYPDASSGIVVKFLKEGVYSIYAHSDYLDTFEAPRSILLEDISIAGTDQTSLWGQSMSAGANLDANFNQFPNTLGVVRQFPGFGANGASATPTGGPYVTQAEWTFLVVQLSGVTKHLREFVFEAIYLGGAPRDSPVSVPASTQPDYADAPAQGISFAFDSDTHATPAWTPV